MWFREFLEQSLEEYAKAWKGKRCHEKPLKNYTIKSTFGLRKMESFGIKIK